jgi:hypothetical protein
MDHPVIARLRREHLIEVSERGSRYLWTARVWEATA